MTLSRRKFLTTSAAAAGLTALGARLAHAGTTGIAPVDAILDPLLLADPGYGPTVAAGPDLALPEGFRYVKFSIRGETMLDGAVIPGGHDGMAAFDVDGRIRLVRNHELGNGTPIGDAAKAWDPSRAGGCTTIDFDPDVARAGLALGGSEAIHMDTWTSQSGSHRNCAGGPTPWGTWLTCEENTSAQHGFVFEVDPAWGPNEHLTATPIRNLGRMNHEAAAVDPATNAVYLTEDAGSSALYRFLPDDVTASTGFGNLVGVAGRFQVLVVEGHDRYDSRRFQTPMTDLACRWVDLPGFADIADDEPCGGFLEAQAATVGAAIFARGEGTWFGNGSCYFASTSGGTFGFGQLWEVAPGADGDLSTLRLVFEADGRNMRAPDNICVSPAGGILLCEDGNNPQHIQAVTPEGRVFTFAENIISGSELAGACFSPDGEWLFVNIQGEGTTYAITGPWAEGPL